MSDEIEKVLRDFEAIRDLHPVLFLDYDGTLVPIVMDPEKAAPSESLLANLGALSRRYELYVVTGRSMQDIETFLGPEFNLIALHGAAWKVNGKYSHPIEDFDRYVAICDSIYGMRSNYIQKYPGLRVYNKGGNILFHFGLMESGRESLITEIEELGKSVGMDTYLGKLIVELRIPGVNKGIAIRELRRGRSALIAGDDATDEDAFRMNQDAILVHVGPGKTLAPHRLKDTEEMNELIERIIELS